MVDAEDLVAARKLSGDLNLGARGETGSRKKNTEMLKNCDEPPWAIDASYIFLDLGLREVDSEKSEKIMRHLHFAKSGW